MRWMVEVQVEIGRRRHRRLNARNQVHDARVMVGLKFGLVSHVFVFNDIIDLGDFIVFPIFIAESTFPVIILRLATPKDRLSPFGTLVAKYEGGRWEGKLLEGGNQICLVQTQVLSYWHLNQVFRRHFYLAKHRPSTHPNSETPSLLHVAVSKKHKTKGTYVLCLKLC